MILMNQSVAFNLHDYSPNFSSIFLPREKRCAGCFDLGAICADVCRNFGYSKHTLD